MSRFKLLLLLLSCNRSFSQISNNFSYHRTYYDHESVISTTEDTFELDLNLKKYRNVFANFNSIQTVFLEPLKDFSNKNLQNLYSIDLGIQKKINFLQNWTMAIRLNPQIRSNDFKNLNKNNFIFNTDIQIHKKIDTNSTITFGLEYGTLFGKPSLYPTLAYQHIINSKINYSLGFPETSITYQLNKKNNFQLISNFSSFYTPINNTNSRVFNQDVLQYESLYLSKINTTLVYQYIFYDNTTVNLKLGKSLNNKLKIEESNNVTSNFDFDNNFNFSMGFKYNLNFKQK